MLGRRESLPDHPIDGLMKTTLDSIGQMIDVNTILGDPVETPDGNVIMPVSRVTFGFAAGGSDWAAESQSASNGSPFGGGGGAGISLNPVGFLVVGNKQIRFLPVTSDAVFDRLLDVVPDVLTRMGAIRPQPDMVKPPLL
jgi:sporulation protein YtfJ